MKASLLLFLGASASQEGDAPAQEPAAVADDTDVGGDDSVATVPAGVRQAEFQKILDETNGLRATHCADPLKWSPALAEHAAKIANCWGDDCAEVKQMHATKAWVSYNDKLPVLDKDGVKTVDSNEVDWSRLANAPASWYTGGGVEPTSFATKMAMIDDIKKNDEAGHHQKSLYVTLVWRAGTSLGCAVSENPELANYPIGTVLDVSEGKKVPARSKIVCIFAGLLSGPGSKVSGSDPYKLYKKQLYPAQDLEAEPTACDAVKASYDADDLFPQFQNTAEAFHKAFNLYRSDTCAPKVAWDESLKPGVDLIMECYDKLNKSDGITSCKEKYEQAFPSEKGGQYASILARTDYCDESNGGCGPAFNHAESRAVLSMFHFFKHFETTLGVSAVGLTHGDFISLFGKATPEQKKDLNTFAIMNWSANTGVYCDIRSKKFSNVNAIENSYIVCAVKTDDDTRPPAYEKGEGDDRYDMWMTELFPSSSGCQLAGGNEVVDENKEEQTGLDGSKIVDEAEEDQVEDELKDDVESKAEDIIADEDPVEDELKEDEVENKADE